MSTAGDRLAEVIRLMVDRPERVLVEGFFEGDRRVLEVHVAEEDLGKVIGRQGRTVRALRSLVAVHAEREGATVELEIAED